MITEMVFKMINSLNFYLKFVPLWFHQSAELCVFLNLFFSHEVLGLDEFAVSEMIADMSLCFSLKVCSVTDCYII